MDRAEVDERIRKLIEPFNKKGVAIGDETTFAGDLEFDSLTVMDFVAAIEDEFDIIISMNQQAEIETWGQLIDAVCKLADAFAHRPPATPANMTLLRCSLCAEHSEEEVETILGMFERAGKAVGII